MTAAVIGLWLLVFAAVHVAVAWRSRELWPGWGRNPSAITAGVLFVLTVAAGVSIWSRGVAGAIAVGSLLAWLVALRRCQP